MSLEVLGGLCDVSAAYLSMVENGKRRLDRYSLIVGLAAALQVPPEEIAPGISTKALAPTPSASTPSRTRYHEDAAVILARVEELGNGVIDPEVIESARAGVQHAVAEYERLDHAALAPALLKQRAGIDASLANCTQPRQREQLLEMAGVTSGLLGYIAVGRGDFPVARAYCLEAFQLGEFTPQMTLQAWSRGLQSFCEYYAGRYDHALHLATDGLNYAQAGPQSVRLAINGAAWALGKLGDANGVDRAVERAYDPLARQEIPGGVVSYGHMHLLAVRYGGEAEKKLVAGIIEADRNDLGRNEIARRVEGIYSRQTVLSLLGSADLVQRAAGALQKHSLASDVRVWQGKKQRLLMELTDMDSADETRLQTSQAAVRALSDAGVGIRAGGTASPVDHLASGKVLEITSSPS